MPSEDDRLRRLIGRLFIVGFHSQTADENIKRLIRAPYYVGQIVLFQRNVRDAEQLAALTAELQQIAKDAGHDQPLTIGIDQENGLVTRIKPPITSQLPGSMALGATRSIDDAHDVGRATGKALRAFGINMNYAPVCDVNNNPENPVIGVRSFSDDPYAVARLAAANLNGLREEGVIPCVKHFPGHGDTAVDSHYGLPLIQKSWEDMEQCELIPFRRAVTEKVPAVMTAHIVIGDSKLPATLDPTILQVLRNDLKFTGVIVSDCLEMNAIRTECGGTVQGAVTALKAGCDSVMICHTIDLQAEALEAVFHAATQDENFMHQLEESWQRVKSFTQEEFTLAQGKQAGQTHASFKQLSTINKDNSELASKVYASSTTAVRMQPGTLPLTKDQRLVFISPGEKPVASGVVEYGQVETRGLYTPPSFIDILRNHHPEIQDIRFYQDGSNADEVLEAAAAADAVILATRNARLAPYQTDMAIKVAYTAKKLIVVATCDPYDFLSADEIQNYLAIYEPTPAAFTGAADVLFGITQARGHLPVEQTQHQHTVVPFSPERDMNQVCALWHEVLPTYLVSKPRLADLLTRPRAAHFVVRRHDTVVGFIATHIQPPAPSAPAGAPPKGLITALIVHPFLAKLGIGTALLTHARQHLCSPPHSCQTLSIGSSFPRFFPGLPLDIVPSNQNFFFHRGFVAGRNSPTARGETCRDLCIDLVAAHAPDPDASMRIARAQNKGIAFRPWTKAGEAECLAKQRRNFGHYAGWVEGYEALAAAGLHGQVMVAHDERKKSSSDGDGGGGHGEQIAWTMMLEPGTKVFLPDLAFPELLGKPDKTGLVACVGVDAAKREGGVGLAMVAAALEEMRGRGVERVFVDWVTLVGWYEKVGLRTWREYLSVEWRRAGAGTDGK
ncbi:Beta-hexosaminidase [Lasiodiplodia theobromae]|uniref:Beta-hexosaminidase n=1 Tax=Lasiodiplodia theobromae TaxID=45133 RepID=A0A5N5CUS3_9PEZI|nr:Beta-hexosaminidase [Lasiodiplodia theobromae]